MSFIEYAFALLTLAFVVRILLAVNDRLHFKTAYDFCAVACSVLAIVFAGLSLFVVEP